MTTYPVQVVRSADSFAADTQGVVQYQHLPARNSARGYSSVAEHSTADREVAGSTPAAP